MKTTHNREYDGIPLGLAVRGSINDEFIYRVRPGNGHYNAVAGEVYQDKFTYFVPSTINNVASEPYRRQWIAAVHKWKYDLTDEEKEVYRAKAQKIRFMSGYNLFMRLAMKGEISMYVDRGDPAAYDFAVGDLTTDASWRDLDLSGIVPSGAKAVLLKTLLQSANPGDAIRYRLKGNSNTINACGCEALRANVARTRMGITSLDANRVIQYNADNIAWTSLSIVVRGWWT